MINNVSHQLCCVIEYINTYITNTQTPGLPDHKVDALSLSLSVTTPFNFD